MTIHLNFTGTVSNFDGSVSGKLRALLGPGRWIVWIPNPVPILSGFECNVTSLVDNVYTCRPNTYTEFIVIICVLSSPKCTKSIFGWGCAPNPAGGAYDRCCIRPRRMVGDTVSYVVGRWLLRSANSGTLVPGIRTTISRRNFCGVRQATWKLEQTRGGTANLVTSIDTFAEKFQKSFV